MTLDQINRAVNALVPNAQFSVASDGSIGWNDGRTQPTGEQVAAKWAEIATAEGAKDVISALEVEQVKRLTPRGDREFRMALFVSAGLTAHPAFIALKAIDDAVRAERAKL